MRIKKLNEWKCDMDIDDVYVKPEGVLGDMIDCFGLKYNHRTGCYDCDGDVNLYDYYDGLNATEQRKFNKAFVNDGKMTIMFGNVKGNFILPGTEKSRYILTSLIGCPQNVGGGFYCGCNRLTSLEFCPEKVGGSFCCRNNQLISLAGCPETVDGDFICNSNQLTSLEGCPKTVGRAFECCLNQLTSLEGCPEKVSWSFNCYNNKLTSLKGCPKKVGGYFCCDDNQLTSLEGCPESVGWNFYCRYNKAQFTGDYVRSVCDVKNEIYV